MINISIKSYKFLFWYEKDFEIRIVLMRWAIRSKNGPEMIKLLLEVPELDVNDRCVIYI